MQENSNIYKVIHLIPRDGIGGVEIAARSMLGTSQLNCDFNLVFIAGTCCMGDSDRVLSSPFRSENNPFAHFHAIKTILSINPDVLVCSLWRSIPVGLVVKLIRPRIKLVFFLHLVSTTHLLDRFLSWLMLCFCDAVWGDSSATIFSRVGTRTHLVKRVISFVTTNNPTNLIKNKLSANFVFWGRLHNQKGLDRSVKFIQILVDKGCDVEFQIWGRDDGEQSKLTTQINQKGLEKIINFMGPVDHSELDRIAEENTFYLQLSRIEGMAMSVIEAMQRALVPIVTPVGEIREYCINDVNAIVVDDVNELDCVAERFIALLENENKYRLMQSSAKKTWENKKLYKTDFRMAAIELLNEHSCPQKWKLAEVTNTDININSMKEQNLHISTVKGFGDEWERFDQLELDPQEAKGLFDSYFALFPWQILSEDATGFDLGCGSGRWAKLVAPRVGHLHCIDPSEALEVAKRNLANNNNCEFHSASVDSMPITDKTMDFGYSLGVLHHVPDTQAALSACVKKLKPGAPFLVYLYYAFDNRPMWFRTIWRFSEILRFGISRLPHGLRYLMSQLIAGVVYYPSARLALLSERVGFDVSNMPLSAYRNLSFYTMRTDALDRFGTRLEQRFTQSEIKAMMVRAGLERIEFSPDIPFWCAIGYRLHAD